MISRCLIDSQLSFRVTKPGLAALAVSAALGAGADDELDVSHLRKPLEQIEFEHGTRTHLLDLPLGEVTVHYRAERELGTVEPAPVTNNDLIRYTRPSRYSPSDRMGGVAM